MEVSQSRAKPRHNKTFSGLPLDENLKSRHAEARCGVQVIDLRTGDAIHWLRIEGIVDELYDVITLPDVRCPTCAARWRWASKQTRFAA